MVHVVVVVLEYDEPFALRKLQQFEAATRSERDRRGVLVTRRNVNATEVVHLGELAQLVDTDPLLVYRNRYELKAPHSQRLPYWTIAQSLDTNRRPGLKQRTRRDV